MNTTERHSNGPVEACSRTKDAQHLLLTFPVALRLLSGDLISFSSPIYLASRETSSGKATVINHFQNH